MSRSGGGGGGGWRRGGKVLGVQAIYHQWDSHLMMIYKVCRERLLLSTVCVNGHPYSTQ
jgi:hypothetical protein